MTLETSLVDIQDISSPQPRSTFPEKNLKDMAELILELGGLIKPLVLKEGGSRRFEVVEGHFEYYGVVKAQEINDDLEMVRAFIINKNSESIVQRQIELLNGKEPINPIVYTPGNDQGDVKNLELRLNNLESRLDELIEHQKQDFKRLIDTLQEEIRAIKTTIPTKTDPLEAFNLLSLPELAFRLKTVNITGKTAEKILKNIDNARKENLFESLTDLVSRVQGLSDKKMLNIIDTWSKTLFL